MRLSLLDILTVHHFDPGLMSAGIATASPGDVLFIFSEYGQQQSLCQIGRQFHNQQGKVVSVTRHTANPLRAQSDAALLVSAHDERVHIEPLLYQSALRHLLDMLFVILSENGDGRLNAYSANLERMGDLHDS